jgi:hypothetical protein
MILTQWGGPSLRGRYTVATSYIVHRYYYHVPRCRCSQHPIVRCTSYAYSNLCTEDEVPIGISTRSRATFMGDSQGLAHSRWAVLRSRQHHALDLYIVSIQGHLIIIKEKLCLVGAKSPSQLAALLLAGSYNHDHQIHPCTPHLSG